MPDSGRHRAAAEEGQPDRPSRRATTTATPEARRSRCGRTYDQQPGPVDRDGEQVAQGADVGLAGDRVAGDDRDGQRQEQPELDGQRGERDEQAVVGDGRKKSGPSGRGCASEILTAMAIRTGTAARTSSPAWLRRRPKISRSSERRNRVRQPPRRGARPRTVGRRTTAQPLTSKPSPVSETNRSSRLGRPTVNAATPTPACTQRGDDLLGCDARRAARGTSPGAGVDVGQAELAHDPRAAASGWSVSTPQPRCRPDRGARRRCPGRPAARRASRRGGCTSARPRRAGGWRPARWCRRRPATRRAGAPRGCPGGRARWSARRGPAGPGARAGRRRWRAAAACRASRRGSACRRPPAGRPGRARRRSGRRAVRGSAVTVGGVEPVQVGPAGEVGMEGRALDQRADPGQGRRGPRRASARPSRLTACRRWVATRPSSIRIVVVLPEPLGPRKP